MSALPDHASRPESPCIGVCTLDDDDVCLGCRRTGDEIGRWTRMTPAEQWAVVQRLADGSQEG